MQQDITYCYYSNFSLFEDHQQEELLLSQRFITKLRLLLGEEWRAHSAHCVLCLDTYMSTEFVFDTLLVAWLSFLKDSDEPNEDDGLRQFEVCARGKFCDYTIDEVFFRPVLSGFFFSASQTWQKLKADIKEQTPNSSQNLKPLAVVKQSLSNYLQPEKRVCLSQRMERLTLEEDSEEKTKQTLMQPLNKLKKLTKLYEKIMQQQLVQTTYHYLGSFLNKTQSSYQVAQSFVMSIIEVNQQHLSNITENTKEIVKVRLLQPAQGFYNDLMEAWILFKQQDNTQFRNYLTTVKSLQGARWSDKYVGPTQFFFNTVAAEWKSINKRPSASLQDEEKKFQQLFTNVKEHMGQYWEKEIISKATQINQNLHHKE